MTEKTCTQCKQTKPIEQFRYRAKRKFYESSCNSCRLQRFEVYKKTVNMKAIATVNAYRKDDKRKELVCTINYDYVVSSLTKPCFYCGQPSSGLDRIDNSIGHTPENCIPCCFKCNTIRNNFFTVEQMLDIASYIKQKGY